MNIRNIFEKIVKDFGQRTMIVYAYILPIQADIYHLVLTH